MNNSEIEAARARAGGQRPKVLEVLPATPEPQVAEQQAVPALLERRSSVLERRNSILERRSSIHGSFTPAVPLEASPNVSTPAQSASNGRIQACDDPQETRTKQVPREGSIGSVSGWQASVP